MALKKKELVAYFSEVDDYINRASPRSMEMAISGMDINFKERAMDALQLFTELLLAVCTIHLIFTTKASVSEWMEKNQEHYPMLAKGETTPVYFDWYVFFDPADLVGRTPRSRVEKSQKDDGITTDKRPRASTPRPRPRA